MSRAALRYLEDGHALHMSPLILPLLGILLPINLAGLLVIKERGVFAPKGRWLLGAILLQGGGGIHCGAFRLNSRRRRIGPNVHR